MGILWKVITDISIHIYIMDNVNMCNNGIYYD